MKFVQFKALLLLTLTLFALAEASAYTLVDGVYYNLNRSKMTASVTYRTLGSSYTGYVTIPSTIKVDGGTYTVTSIGKAAFKDCISVSGVNIPSTITVVDANSFYGCLSLELISFSSNLTTIEQSAFEGCSSLKRVKLSDEEAPIGSSGPYMVITSKLTKIGPNSFKDCYSLKEIHIPSSVTFLGAGAFSGCKALTEVTLPDGIEYVYSSLFSNCRALKNVVIPEGCKVINDHAFEGCSALEYVKFPESLNSISVNAFLDCITLKTIVIPQNVNSLDARSFSGCRSLEKIEVEEGNTTFDSRNNCNAIIHTEKKQVVLGCMNSTIPYEIEEIGSYAFNGCNKLVQINFPKTLRKIGYSAFSGCWRLTGIDLPENLLGIEKYAFQGCATLQKAIIPEGTLWVESGAFQNCENLSFAVIPSSVSSIGSDAFSGCPKLCAVSFSSNASSNKFSETAKVILVPRLYTFTSTQSTVTLTHTPTESFDVLTYTLNDDVKHPDQTVVFTGLAPNKYDKVLIDAFAFGKRVSGYLDIHTQPISMSVQLLAATNTTLHVKGTYDSGDAIVESAYFSSSDMPGINTEATISGLRPGKSYSVSFYVKTSDGSTHSTYGNYNTLPVTVSAKAIATGPTSATLQGSYSMIDATYVSSGFNNDEGDETKIYGLDPNTHYSATYYLNTREGGKTTTSVSYQTTSLKLETRPAIAASNNKAIISATTNGEDDALRFGFEWRRYDAPPEMPSYMSGCPVIDGELKGSLNNLSASTYYKYRIYYQANSGKTYYGDWVAFITADAYVYFEPILYTYEAQLVGETSAMLRGIAMNGSDDFIEQGFEFWPVGNTRGVNDKVRVMASGQLMTAVVDNLKPGTDYCFRTFATTPKGTVYGTEKAFKTKEGGIDTEIREVQSVPNDDNAPIYDLRGRRVIHPVRKGIYIKNGHKIVM